MYARAIDSASKELHVIDEPVTRIEQQHRKQLVLESPQFDRQEFPDYAR